MSLKKRKIEKKENKAIHNPISVLSFLSEQTWYTKLTVASTIILIITPSFKWYWFWILICLSVIAIIAFITHCLLISQQENVKLAEHIVFDISGAIQSTARLSGILSQNMVATHVANDVCRELDTTKNKLQNLALSLNKSGSHLQGMTSYFTRAEQMCFLIAMIAAKAAVGMLVSLIIVSIF